MTGLAGSADRRLEGDVPDDTRRNVIDSIRVTRDRVVIDNTFATRDLVADANRTAVYRVITLSDHKSRVFIGEHLIAADDIEAHDVIEDAIDELIELVLNDKGRVAILPDGNLADHDRLAAVLRY